MPYNKPSLQPGQFVLYAVNRILNTSYQPKQIENGLDYDNPTPTNNFINTYIPITFYDGNFSSKFSTYDENLQIKDNAQYSFTFSVAKYINNELNPIFYLIVENRRLRLQTYEMKIDFIITGITPNITNNNVIYSVTCQDVFSYDLSKQSAKISYETTTPLNIRDLAKEVLLTCQLDGRWNIDPALENNYHADFPSYQKLAHGVTETTNRMMASLGISDSTPYNAFIEVCKKFNASLDVEYSDEEIKPGVIYFKNKTTSQFSGYHLRSEVNMSAFSVSRKTDSFCSIMHISGGEDAYGQLVSIVPTMPQDVQKYFTMLQPHNISTEEEKLALFANTSYPYLVTTSGGVDTLYRRYENSNLFAAIAGGGITTDPYIPWTKMTSEEIEKDFNTFNTQVGDQVFKTANTLEITEYFNFLKYRCKAAASFFYDFEYYLNAGLMDKYTYEQLNRIFSIDLRNANIMLYCTSYQYNLLSLELKRLEDQEEELLAQLTALDEQLYNLYMDPEKDPHEVILAVSDTNDSALSRTTHEMSIKEAQIAALSDLMENVWTSRYYQLLFTLQGSNAIENKLASYNTKIQEKQDLFYAEWEVASRILNENAAIGYFEFGAYSITQPSAVTAATIYSTSGTAPNITYTATNTSVGFITDEKGAYVLLLNRYSSGLSNSGTERVIYKNAVLNTTPKETIEQWPFGAANSGLTGAVGSIDDLQFDIYRRDYTTDTQCRCYHFAPKVAQTTAEREEYLQSSDQTSYVNYSVARNKSQDALDYIYVTPDMTDSSLQFRREALPSRRGLYAMTAYYLEEMLTREEYGLQDAKRQYLTPINLQDLLRQAQLQQSSVWRTIYDNYSDFIAETSFSDTDQLSSEGLFMTAMETFTKYKNPTYEYSTTVINTNAIADLRSKAIRVNDIVYVYNKDVSSEYTGRLIVSIPRKSIGRFYNIEDFTQTISRSYIVPSELSLEDGYVIKGITTPPKNTIGAIAGPCKLYCRNRSYIHPYALKEDGTDATIVLSAVTYENAPSFAVDEVKDNGSIIDVYLKCPETSQAVELMTVRASIDTLELLTSADDGARVYTNVLDIRLEERAKPIALQVTGVTQKLRESTTQLTVSTDRTMDLIFQRLVQQARL